MMAHYHPHGATTHRPATGRTTGSATSGGDFLLIYRLTGAAMVVFVRAGTHADLFE